VSVIQYDINVVADPNKHAPASPDPVGADGTVDGISTIATQQFGLSIGSIIEDVVSAISCFWTLENWWSLCHILVNLVVSVDVSVAIHVTLDLLGCVDMKEFNPSLFGIKSMSLEQGEQIVNAIDAETIWSRAVQTMIGVTALLFLVAQLMAVFLTSAWESLFWATIGAAPASFVFTMALLVWQTRQFNLDPVTKGIYFFCSAILAIGTAILNYAKVCELSSSSGGNAIFKYFSKTYYDGNAVTKAKGFKGRSHTALMFTQIVCFISVLVIASGFALNLW
jgi:hypothetical protein